VRRTVLRLLVCCLLAIPGCDSLSVPVATATPPPPTAAPILPNTPTPPTPEDPATPAPSPTPPPIPTSTPVPLMVGKTGGDGIWLRSAPSIGKKLKAWPDGTTLDVVGPDQTVGNQTWKNVRDPDGSVGWIAAEFLVPTAATGSARTPTTLPSGAARPTSTPTP